MFGDNYRNAGLPLASMIVRIPFAVLASAVSAALQAKATRLASREYARPIGSMASGRLTRHHPPCHQIDHTTTGDSRATVADPRPGSDRPNRAHEVRTRSQSLRPSAF